MIADRIGVSWERLPPSDGPGSLGRSPGKPLEFAVTMPEPRELGTAMPRAGGAYYYINDSLGPLFGSVAGWGNWLGLVFATAFYMIGLGSCLTILVPVPEVWLLSPAQVGALTAAALFVAINYLGTKETGLWFAVLPAAGLIFVTYLGFAEINTVAEELKDPGHNLPRAVIGSLLFVIVLYGVVMIVLMGVEPYETIVDYGQRAVALVAESMLGCVGLVLHLTVYGLLNIALIGFMAPVEILLSVGFVAFGVLWFVLYARRRAEPVSLVGEAIVRVVGEPGVPADQVLMGWTGKRRGREYIFGSTLDPVLQHAPCEVSPVTLRNRPIGQVAAKVARAAGLEPASYRVEILVGDDIRASLLESIKKFDTICCGMSTTNRVERIFFGSLAERVVREAPGNVVLVRGPFRLHRSVRQALAQRLLK